MFEKYLKKLISSWVYGWFDGFGMSAECFRIWPASKSQAFNRFIILRQCHRQILLQIFCRLINDFGDFMLNLLPVQQLQTVSEILEKSSHISTPQVSERIYWREPVSSLDLRLHLFYCLRLMNGYPIVRNFYIGLKLSDCTSVSGVQVGCWS